MQFDRLRRREFITLLGGTAAAWPLAARAQQATKAALIARLHPGSAHDAAIADGLRAFQHGMRALGYAEGQTYRLEDRYSEGSPARLLALAAELVALKPDVIIAVADDAVRAAKDATATIPIVMAMATRDPVGAGYIASLARPGGNVTGFTGQVEELNAKQLELLRELVPGLTDVAIMYNSGSPAVTRERLDQITQAGAALGLKIRQAGIARPTDWKTVFEALEAANVGGLMVLPEPAIMDQSRARIAEMALRHRLPTVFTFRMYVEAGGLMSYAQDLPDMHRRSATYVDRILKGAKPSDLPVEQPTKFELVVNLRTARALGLDVPATVLVRADEVIE
jgi:putative ABC transport system substrate-binding protein